MAVGPADRKELSTTVNTGVIVDEPTRSTRIACDMSVAGRFRSGLLKYRRMTVRRRVVADTDAEPVVSHAASVAEPRTVTTPASTFSSQILYEPDAGEPIIAR
jgi:hypothetical protein